MANEKKATIQSVTNPVKLAELINAIIGDIDQLDDLTDELAADHDVTGDTIDGLTAKLDADSGITSTDYAATWGVGGTDSSSWPADLTESTITRLTTATA